MIKVLKYKIGNPPIEMHKGAKILKVAMQYGDICMWALVDTDKEMEIRVFYIYGTGQRIPTTGSINFVDTVFENGGLFVWHVFEQIFDSVGAGI